MPADAKVSALVRSPEPKHARRRIGTNPAGSLVVATTSGVLQVHDGEWVQLNPVVLTGLASTPDGVLLGLSEDEAIYHSADSARTWTLDDAGLYKDKQAVELSRPHFTHLRHAGGTTFVGGFAGLWRKRSGRFPRDGLGRDGLARRDEDKRPRVLSGRVLSGRVLSGSSVGSGVWQQLRMLAGQRITALEVRATADGWHELLIDRYLSVQAHVTIEPGGTASTTHLGLAPTRGVAGDFIRRKGGALGVAFATLGGLRVGTCANVDRLAPLPELILPSRNANSSRPEVVKDLKQVPGGGPVFMTHRPRGLLRSHDGLLSTKTIWSDSKLIFWGVAISPGFSDDNTLFVPTGKTVFRSTDGGRTMRPLAPKAHPRRGRIAVSPRFVDDRTLFSDAGTLWMSRDAGDTWTSLDGYLGDHQVAPSGWDVTAVPGELRLLVQA